ncbi:MAG: DUF4249 domain-containing protein [Bacteroidetes bacterium]|nr:MAG: DUF4249 domain-containing protein [Bacteroidota bacterium]
MKKIIYTLALAIVFSACEEKIDLDLSFAGQKPVVEGRVTTETDSSYIQLSYTAPYNSNGKPPAITTAVVEVTKDNGTPVIFNHTANGVYKPAAGYVGVKNSTYHLKVVIDGKEYTSTSKLEPMFSVDDTLEHVFKPKEGFLDEGYAITFWGTYDQAPVKNYWFKYGKNDTLEEGDVLFDNADIELNKRSAFELPFFRPQKGDSVMLYFRSIDVYAYNYLYALSMLNSGAPGPFQAPPANPPTNIKGGALGFFYAADVVRRWKIVN